MRELVNYHAQRVIGSAGFRTRINLPSRRISRGTRARIPSPLDSSYVPPREIIYRLVRRDRVALYFNPLLSARLNGFEFSIQSYR
jgi:hypothetical protein